jgi:hypothetical protein
MQGKRFGAAVSAAVALLLSSIVPGQTGDALAGARGTDGAEAAFGWERVFTPTTMNLNGVFGSGTVAAAVGAGGVGLLFDGEDWNLVFTPTQLPLEAVWAASRDDIFAVGASGNIFRFSLDGDVERMPSGTAIKLHAVWGRSATEVYAAGDNGTMLRFDGTQWTYELVPTVNALRGIAVTPGGDVYVVGDFGKIFRREAGEWVLMPVDTQLNLNAVWPLADDDIFAVGNSGKVFRFDGRDWILMDTPTTANLYGVWGTSQTRLFASGMQGNIISFDGDEWVLTRLDTWANLNAINNGFVAGDGGILYQNPQLYPEVSNLRITEVDPITGEVEVTNTGTRFVSGDHPFCHWKDQDSFIPQGTEFPAGGIRVFDVVNLNANYSDLWLYRTVPFSNPENVVHGLQYGDEEDLGCTGVAVAAGVWPSPNASVPAPPLRATIAYDGFGYSTLDWYTDETPTIGGPNVTQAGTVAKSLDYPLGKQDFESVALGDEVIAIQDWTIVDNSGVSGIFTSHVVDGDDGMGGPDARWVRIRDQDAGDKVNRIYTPVIEALEGDDFYRWTFRINVAEPPPSSDHGPRMMVQHEVETGVLQFGFYDTWGVEFRADSAYLVVDHAGGEPGAVALYELESPYGVGDWVIIEIDVDLDSGDIAAFVDGSFKGELPISPVEGTDPAIYRLSYDGDGPGNVGTTLLDNVEINALPPVLSFTEVGAEAIDDGATIWWSFAGDESIDGFRVYRRGSDETDESIVSGEALLNAEAREFEDTGLDSDQTYDYRVAAVRPDGSQILSQTATTAPEAARPLEIGRIAAMAKQSDAIVWWDISGNGDYEGFRLYRRRDGEPQERVISGTGLLPAGTRQFVDTDVVAWNTYHYRVAVVEPDGTEMASQAVTVRMRTSAYTLTHGQPNPFSASTSFQYTLPRSGPVTVRVYDVRGALVATLEDAVRAEGVHTVSWDGRDNAGNVVSGGTYFVKLHAPDADLTRKIVLIR